MHYISTNPEQTEQSILELIQIVKQGGTRAIDGEVLANLLELCHMYGLTKEELMNLKIGDVKYRGKVRNNIRLGREFNPSIKETNAERLIERHYSYLKAKGYSRRLNFPLFPMKSNEFYDPSNLQKHLEKFYRPFWSRKCLSSIRQAAICRHYDDMKYQGLGPEACLGSTAIFAGHKTGNRQNPDYRHTENVLRNR